MGTRAATAGATALLPGGERPPTARPPAAVRAVERDDAAAGVPGTGLAEQDADDEEQSGDLGRAATRR